MLAALVRWSFALALLCTGSWAQGALITYTFEGVFDDGGTLKGWATVDLAKPDPYGDGPDYDYELITTKGSRPIEPGVWRNAFLWPHYPQSEQGPASIDVHLGTSHQLGVAIYFRQVANRNDYMAPLYIIAGEDTLFPFEPPFETHRFLRSNNVSATAVPEPKTYAMILAGLVLIGAISAKARR
jgi:PEP-CTERM motif